MKRTYLFLVLAIFCDTNLFSQEWWTRYTKQEKENILLEKARQAVLKYGDERYYTMRSGYKIDSLNLLENIVGSDGREVYGVSFLYDSTKMRFIRKYLARAIIPKDTCEVVLLTFGTGYGPTSNMQKKIEFKELEHWEVKTIDLISVFAKEGFMKTFLFVDNPRMLLSNIEVVPKSICVKKGFAYLECKNNQTYSFPVIDSKSKSCIEWLNKVINEDMAVLIYLVKDKDNVIGRVSPSVKDIRERYKAREEKK